MQRALHYLGHGYFDWQVVAASIFLPGFNSAVFDFDCTRVWFLEFLVQLCNRYIIRLDVFM